MSDQDKTWPSIVSSVPQIYFDIIARVVPGIAIIISLMLAALGPKESWNILQSLICSDCFNKIPAATIFIPLTFILSYVFATLLWCFQSRSFFSAEKYWDSKIFRKKYEVIKLKNPAAGDRITKLKAQVHMFEVLTVGFDLSGIVVLVRKYCYHLPLPLDPLLIIVVIILIYCSWIARCYCVKHMISSLDNNIKLLGCKNISFIGSVVLLFDFDGTLVDLNKLQAYKNVIDNNDCLKSNQVSAKDLCQTDNDLCMDGEYDRRKVFEAHIKKLDSKDINKLCQAFWKEISQTQKIKPHCCKTLKKLQNAGYSLVCVTDSDDFGGNKSQRIKKSGLSSFFDRVFIGMENVPIRKGDERYIEYIARELDLTPNKCIMIGDKTSIDLEPAKLVGMSTILVKNEPYPDNWSPQVEDLSDLITIIETLMLGV